MSVVSNSSPLIALAQIQRLNLVSAILQSVLIPPAVAREIAPSIPVLPQWATVRAPPEPSSVLTSPRRLGDGEREAIALAMEVGAGAIVLDDRAARRVAEAAGRNVIGTLGLLLEAKRKGVVAFDIRQAERPDVDEIAAAHRDSIQSVGPTHYSDDVGAWWQEAIEGQLYLKAMDGGEVFFIALGDVDGRRAVLGFASDYCIEGQRHGTSVYVRGRSARQGIGSALLGKAEARAIETGATSIEIGVACRWTSTGRTASSRSDAGKRA